MVLQHIVHPRSPTAVQLKTILNRVEKHKSGLFTNVATLFAKVFVVFAKDSLSISRRALAIGR